MGAEGIFSYKSFGSLIAGLTIGYLAGWRLEEDILSDVSAPLELDLLTEVSESLTIALSRPFVTYLNDLTLVSHD